MFGRKKDLSRFHGVSQSAQPYVEHVNAPIESKPADIVYPDRQSQKPTSIAMDEVSLPSKNNEPTEDILLATLRMVGRDIESDHRLLMTSASRYPNDRNIAYGNAVVKNLRPIYGIGSDKPAAYIEEWPDEFGRRSRLPPPDHNCMIQVKR